MCPQDPQRRRVLLLLFILCLRRVSPLDGGTLFEKIELPSEVVASCPLVNVSHPSGSGLSSSYFCALQCIAELACTAYCITGSNADPEGVRCVLLKAMAIPSGSRIHQQSSSGSCFVPFRPPWPRGVDLARGKTVKVAGSWNKEYAGGETVVSGSRCEVSEYNCFCTSLQLTSSLVVDLGATMPVTTVVVTVSSYFPEFFNDVVISVGDKGDNSDTQFVKYSGPAKQGEVLVLRGQSTLFGRYVTIYRRNFSLCLCLLQVYSV